MDQRSGATAETEHPAAVAALQAEGEARLAQHREHTRALAESAAQYRLERSILRVALSDLALRAATRTMRDNPDMPESQRLELLSAGLHAAVEAFGYQPEPVTA